MIYCLGLSLMSTNPPLQPIQLETKEATAADKPSLVIQFSDGKALEGLLPSSLNHLQIRLGEFCQQVVREARSIERTEHAGAGPAEIIAAHIDEAWWVSRRRIRRSKHPTGGAIVRIVQALGIAGFGVGASNLKSASWGPWVFVGCAVVTCIAFLIEVHLQRTE
jgi:hypothetical protein